MFNSKYFKLGQVVVTCRINNSIAESLRFLNDVLLSMNRHCNKDWGDLSEEDKAMNDEAVRNGNDRIFSSYQTCEGEIWIITEEDRSVTTILFPDEY